jgi:hypothetical protein
MSHSKDAHAHDAEVMWADMAQAVDAAQPTDLAMHQDLAKPQDMATQHDLAHPLDLAHPVDASCVPRACGPMNCGDMPDGCGNTLHCGGCKGNKDCGEDKPNVCGG